jgi:hypothetical protein
MLAAACADRLGDLAVVAVHRARQQVERWHQAGCSLGTAQDLLGADRIVVALGGSPPPETALAVWGGAESRRRSESLIRDLPSGGHGGALAISPDSGKSVVVTRPVWAEVRHWAGDPTKSLMGTEDRISPRRSFALWKEDIRTACRPWSAADGEILTGVAREWTAQAVAVDPLAWRSARWACLLVDSEGRLSWSNDALQRWCGRPVAGQSPQDPLSHLPCRWPQAVVTLRDCLSGHRRLRLDVPVFGNGGMPRCLDVSLHPLPTGVTVIIAEDITTVRQWQAQVAAAAEATADAVCRRTRLVDHLGCRSDRGPATGWASVTAVADVQPLRLAARRLLATGNPMAPVFAAQVDEALAVAGLLPFAREPISVQPLLADIATQLRPITSGRGFTVQIALGPDAPRMVTADAARLREVLLKAIAPCLVPRPEATPVIGLHAVGVAQHPGHVQFIISGGSGPSVLSTGTQALLASFGGTASCADGRLTLTLTGSV